MILECRNKLAKINSQKSQGIAAIFRAINTQRVIDVLNLQYFPYFLEWI